MGAAACQVAGARRSRGRASVAAVAAGAAAVAAAVAVAVAVAAAVAALLAASFVGGAGTEPVGVWRSGAGVCPSLSATNDRGLGVGVGRSGDAGDGDEPR